MKKQLISEAFRLQQLAGIKPIYSLKEIDKRNDTIGKIIVNNKEVDVDSIEFDSDSYNPNFDDVWITSAKFVDGTNLSDREKEDLLDDYHYELRPVIYNYLH